jgi:serine/threonine-protein kinase
VLYDAIASGGMATVHLGRLLGPVGFARTVAIKRLHPHFARDPEFVAMFLDEARLAARIRHPNVVPTLDVVALDGELVLVMEYVPGESLGSLVRAVGQRKENVPIPYAVSITAGALRGLHAAHEATDEQGKPLGMVHRDISPQNILVGVDGVARVLDFGVAKAAGRVQVTRDGQLKGKIAYMSPEQIRSSETDRRTDIYAAGVVLWEMLTGQRLFSAENEIAVFHKVFEGIVQRPSEVNPYIPAALDAIVVRALAKSPADRFATARDMAAELEGAVPLVSNARVGEWVEATGAGTLASRTQAVTRIELESSPAAEQASRPRLPTTPPSEITTSEVFVTGTKGPRPSSTSPLPTASVASGEVHLDSDLLIPDDAPSPADPAQTMVEAPPFVKESGSGKHPPFVISAQTLAMPSVKVPLTQTSPLPEAPPPELVSPQPVVAPAVAAPAARPAFRMARLGATGGVLLTLLLVGVFREDLGLTSPPPPPEYPSEAVRDPAPVVGVPSPLPATALAPLPASPASEAALGPVTVPPEAVASSAPSLPSSTPAASSAPRSHVHSVAPHMDHGGLGKVLDSRK